jgi:CRISPR system Cascade subunit CasB
MTDQLEFDLPESEYNDSTGASDTPPPDRMVLTEDVQDNDRPKQFASSVGKMAKMMATEGALGTGTLAELRRISPEKPFTPSLWNLLLDLDEAEPWGGLDRNVYERRMATLAMGMAICAGLHNYREPLGRALAEAGWSKLRFVRLMEARGETLEKHLRRMAQYLASKGHSANWVDVGWLLLGQDWETAEETRLRISRSYYGTLHAKEQE